MVRSILSRTTIFWSALACSVTLVSAYSIAQLVPPSPPIPKFTSRTELVTVPVVVLRSGEHVAGLTKDDFEVEEDGQRRLLASFEEIGGVSPKLLPVTPPPGVYTNEVIADGPVAMVVILLDLVNTPYKYQDTAKRKLLDYLAHDYHSDRPTMLAVLHSGGLRVLHEFTTDPQILASIARRIRNNIQHDPALDNRVQNEIGDALEYPPDVAKEYDKVGAEFMGNNTPIDRYQQRIDADRVDVTFYSLEQLADALKAVHGSKSLIWISGGITLPPAIDQTSRKVVDEYNRALKQLSAAGVVVYPIDTVIEASNPGYSDTQYLSPAPKTGTLPIVGPMQVVQNFMDISERTGGDYCLLRRESDQCFRKAMDYSSRYYMLTYYAQPSETVLWRRIHVKVHGKGLQVRARSGYFTVSGISTSDDRRKRDIAQAVITPVEYRSLPLSVRWAPGDQSPKEPTSNAALSTVLRPELSRPKRTFFLGIDSKALGVDTSEHNHINLALVVVSLGSQGNVLADLTQEIDLHPSAKDLERLRNKGFVYSNAIEVPPLTEKVRFIVRDNLRERVGTVSVPIARP